MLTCCNNNKIHKSNFNHLSSELKNNIGITMVILFQKECVFCRSFKNLIKPLLKKFNEEKEILRVFSVDVDDLSEIKLFPHLKYPVIYFWLKNLNFPIIKYGGAPTNVIEHEINQLIRVINGEKLKDVYK